MTCLGVIGDILEFDGGDSVFSCIEWMIPDFASLSGEGGDYYGSPVFDACDGEWYICIHPYGISREPPSPWVNLVLYRLDEGPTKTLNVTLGIRGPEGVKNEKRRIQEFSGLDFMCSWSGFCLQSELTEQNSRLMPGNVLTLRLSIESVVPRVATESSTPTAEEAKKDDSTEENQSLEKLGIEKLSEDIGKLLVSGENTDVTVQVGDVEFKAHRAILSARCPVLSAMFKHETEEKVTNRITIIDCEPEIFKEYLQYLYTGSVQRLSEKNVFGLYRVADKYLADDLKQRCLQYIQCTLSVQTFCDAVQLALMHGQSGLLDQATDFANRNIRSIIRTVEWQNFNRDHPTEANEILIKALGPPS